VTNEEADLAARAICRLLRVRTSRDERRQDMYDLFLWLRQECLRDEWRIVFAAALGAEGECRRDV
jgi:hypothetical protein